MNSIFAMDVMYIKKFLALYFLIFTFIGSNLHANEPLEFLDREWDYIEEVLIAKPAEDAKHNALNNIWFAPILGFGLAGYIADTLIDNKSNNSTARADNIFAIGCIGFFIGIGFFITYRDAVFEQFVYENFLEIIEEWPKHQRYIPACFHPAFNECVELFHTYGSNSPEWQKKSESMINALQKAIMNHFTQKYYRQKINNTVLVI
ncbi:MAG: hypothetical protein WDZ41_04320 [Candidatus Babeliales bacterium]